MEWQPWPELKDFNSVQDVIDFHSSEISYWCSRDQSHSFAERAASIRVWNMMQAFWVQDTSRPNYGTDDRARRLAMDMGISVSTISRITTHREPSTILNRAIQLFEILKKNQSNSTVKPPTSGVYSSDGTPVDGLDSPVVLLAKGAESDDSLEAMKEEIKKLEMELQAKKEELFNRAWKAKEESEKAALRKQLFG